MIGVFWIYKNHIYLKSIKHDIVQAINNYIDSDFSHYQVWEEISTQNKDFYLYEYEDIPRGRVVYDVLNDQYIVYANQDIIASDKIKKIVVQKFNLTENTVLFTYDEHYKIYEENS